MTMVHNSSLCKMVQDALRFVDTPVRKRLSSLGERRIRKLDDSSTHTVTGSEHARKNVSLRPHLILESPRQRRCFATSCIVNHRVGSFIHKV